MTKRTAVYHNEPFIGFECNTRNLFKYFRQFLAIIWERFDDFRFFINVFDTLDYNGLCLGSSFAFNKLGGTSELRIDICSQFLAGCL